MRHATALAIAVCRLSRSI